MLLVVQILSAVCFIGFLFYRYFITSSRDYWSKRGIPLAEGLWPVFGHFWEVLRIKRSFAAVIEDIYYANRQSSMVGVFDMDQPLLLIRDPDLVKFVLATGFNNFRHHESLSPNPKDLLSCDPFVLNDNEWKDARILFVNAFTSKKLKSASSVIRRVCSNMMRFVESQVENQSCLDVETIDLFTRVTSQIAADTILSLEENSFDEKAPQLFKDMMADIFSPSFINAVRNNIVRLFPRLGRYLGVAFVSTWVNEKFHAIVEDVRATRKTDGILRNDILQHIIDFPDKKEIHSHVSGHVFSFFIEMYLTSSHTLSFMMVDLANHQDIQTKLRDEIKTVMKRHGNEISYEAVSEMTYMDQVISESMRLIPVGGSFKKVCAEETELVGSDGLKCKLKPGDSVVISVNGLQNDSDYWQNPNDFRPERFDKNSEEYQRRHKYVYLPFSEGPRQCPGIRFAFLVMKTVLATIVNNYSIEKSPKLKEPFILDPASMLPCIKDGAWVRLKHMS